MDIGKEDRDALQSQLLRFVKKFASSVFSIFHFFCEKKTVLWNGPLGVFEWKEGAQGRFYFFFISNAAWKLNGFKIYSFRYTGYGRGAVESYCGKKVHNHCGRR